jgi:hypothetical protein
MPLATPLAKALYSASVLDLGAVGCFFELQEMRFGPTKIENPLMDRRSSTHHAQSASVKILILVEADLQ